MYPHRGMCTYMYLLTAAKESQSSPRSEKGTYLPLHKRVSLVREARSTEYIHDRRYLIDIDRRKLGWRSFDVLWSTLHDKGERERETHDLRERETSIQPIPAGASE
jgi:hypothetical protein